MAASAVVMEKEQAMAGFKCASCDQPPRDGRLIRCLHTLCALCVEPHIKDDNTIHCPNCAEITPSPGPRRSQLQSLPRAPLENGAIASADSSSSTRSARVVCEECDEEEAATFNCHDCSMFYCTDHGKAHLKSKSTKSHRTERICEDPATSSNISEQTSQTSRCSLHQKIHNASFEWYCTECKEFLCETCRATHRKAHVQNSDQVMPIADAARNARRGLKQKVSEQGTKRLNIISTAQTAANASTELLSDTYGALSSDITAAFAKLEKLSKERCDELLREAHSKYWQQSSVLERRVEKLKRKRTRLTRMYGLIKSSTEDIDFLRLHPWLLGKMTEEDKDAATTQPLTGLEMPMFKSNCLDTAVEVLRKIRSIEAADSDPEDSQAASNAKNYKFSLRQCHPKLVLTNDDRTIYWTRRGATYRSVCVEPYIQVGTVATAKFRFDLNAPYLSVGVCNPLEYVSGLEKQTCEVRSHIKFRNTGECIKVTADRQKHVLSFQKESTGEKWAGGILCEEGVLAFYGLCTDNFNDVRLTILSFVIVSDAV
ncbi:E3 ubiquitin-protein ligase TRIM56-like [Sycon ciliatum]|uniref:E3 ubiquitin-protein ligase TRIM56-like n=1 Tax=Sycon ciliatum TaxID=27933 RepID=UPI0031F6150B